MKKLIVAAVLLLMMPASAPAQHFYSRPNGQGYVLVGGGTKQMTPALALGGEVYTPSGVGLGLEVGGTALSTAPDPNLMLGVGSLNLSYHVFGKKVLKNFAPYASGGYTLFFGHNSIPSGGKDVTTSGFNLGGGVDILAKKHFGLRFDVRYYGHGGRILHYIYPKIDQFSFVAFRIGVTFR